MNLDDESEETAFVAVPIQDDSEEPVTERYVLDAPCMKTTRGVRVIDDDDSDADRSCVGVMAAGTEVVDTLLDFDTLLERKVPRRDGGFTRLPFLVSFSIHSTGLWTVAFLSTTAGLTLCYWINGAMSSHIVPRRLWSWAYVLHQ